MNRISKRARSRMMARVRTKGTAPELAVRSWLRSRHFGYRVNVRGLPGTPDVVLHKYRTVVCVHGCFWHNHTCCVNLPKTNTGFWRGKFNANLERDIRNEKALRAMGWEVITVWECETVPGGIMGRKLAVLEERRRSWLRK